jgi:type VI secretion system secreted protein VgrG
VYCTQYHETDYEFVTRLLAEEGIFFTFARPAAQSASGADPLAADVLVLADHEQAYAPVPAGVDADWGEGASGAIPAALAGALARGTGAVGALGGLDIASGLASAAALGLEGQQLVHGVKDQLAGAAALRSRTQSLSHDVHQVKDLGHALSAGREAAHLAGGLTHAAGGAMALGREAGQILGTLGGAAGLSEGGGASGGGSPATFAVEHGHRAVDPDALLDFTLRGEVRPNAVLLSTYDPARPLYRPMASAQLAGPAGQASPPHLQATMAAGFLSVHDHHSRSERSDGDGIGGIVRARARLAQLRRDALAGEAKSGNCRLAPGLTFQLRGHPMDEVDGGYVVTSLEHRGMVQHMCREDEGETYRNVVRCAPAGAPYRPLLPTRRMAQVAETATVVGPPGEEIHTDASGRIRVRFHWDQEDRPEEGTSSCWMRVMQPWAGAGFGAQFIPRIGTEVLVTFVRGDPDDPLVVGGMFNGGSPTPFDLPFAKTRSGFRTASTSGTGGYNELVFEDATGAEAIQLRAQRDLDEEVGRRHVQHVRGAQRVVVEGARSKVVHAADTELVLGTKRSEVALDRADEIHGEHRSHVHKARTDAVDGADAREIALDQTLTVRGARSVVVNGSLSTRAGTKEKPAEILTSVEGAHTTRATRRILLTSDEEIVLQCGNSRVVVGPDAVRIETPHFAVAAKDVAELEAAGAALHLTDSAQLTGQAVRHYSQGASVELTATADINGAMVNLNCGAGSPKRSDEKGDGPKTKPVKMKLHDDELKPFAGKRYRLVAGDYRREGITGSEGEVDEEVPAATEVAQLTLWLEGYPSGPTMEWEVQASEEPLAQAGSVRGALQRLLHLGYYTGAVGVELTAEGQAAVRWFQTDYGLDPTGALDAATGQKLKEIHGT